jgi:AcrR family transcriptional regulator
VNRQITRSPEQRTDAILASAAQLVAAQGVEFATLPRIARASGEVERTVIYYFGSKNGILREVCLRQVRALLEAVENADQPEQTGRPRLDAAAHATLLEAKARLALVDRQDLDQQRRWLVLLMTDAMIGVLPALQGRPDLIEPAAQSLLTMLTEHDRWFSENGPMSRSNYAQFAVTMVLSGVTRQLYEQ